MIERLHPRQNSDLEGHGIAENQLINAWTTGRLHHAWLISGRKGIGKATLAYRFARFLLTHGNPASEKDRYPTWINDKPRRYDLHRVTSPVSMRDVRM